MIGHQYVGVNGAAKFGGKFLKVMQVELVILLGIETNRAVVAALDDVPRDIGDGKAGAARHGESLRMEELQDNRKPWSVPYYFLLFLSPIILPYYFLGDPIDLSIPSFLRFLSLY